MARGQGEVLGGVLPWRPTGVRVGVEWDIAADRLAQVSEVVDAELSAKDALERHPADLRARQPRDISESGTTEAWGAGCVGHGGPLSRRNGGDHGDVAHLRD